MEAVFSEAHRLLNFPFQIFPVAGAALIHPVQFDLMCFIAGVDHHFRKGRGITGSHIDSVGVHISDFMTLGKQFTGVDILPFCFINTLHDLDIILRNRAKIRKRVLFRFRVLREVQFIDRVSDKHRFLKKQFDLLFHFFFRSSHGNIRPGTSEKTVKLPVDLHPDVFHIAGAVLIEPMADEIEFPAGDFPVGDLPGIRGRFLQTFHNPVNHYPSLAFALRYGPPSATLTHSLCPFPQAPFPNTRLSVPAIETLLSRSGT